MMYIPSFRFVIHPNRSPEQIEKKFEATRTSYLRDLEKLRKRYQRAFVDLSNEYSSACTTAIK